jgi:hypothetical protein
MNNEFKVVRISKRAKLNAERRDAVPSGVVGSTPKQTMTVNTK